MLLSCVKRVVQRGRAARVLSVYAFQHLSCKAVVLCCAASFVGGLSAQEKKPMQAPQVLQTEREWLHELSHETHGLHVARLSPTVLTIGIHQVQAELAATPATRQQGLMYRSKLGASQGMLFVFAQPAKQCFWMKNTLVALDAAFIGADGRISRIVQMQPLDETAHCSTKAVGYVLEVNHGWFNKRRIKEGDEVQHLPPLSVAQ